jgi:hypothetical protein
MANSLRDIQALLRYDDSKLHSQSTLYIPIKKQSRIEDKNRISRCWNRQRCLVNPILLQKLRPAIILKTVIHNRRNLPNLMQAHIIKAILRIPNHVLK